MPILHRHVVPNVPAWTADNGKIVHNAGGISHRRKVKFRVAFDWAPDFLSSAYWDTVAAGFPDFVAWAGTAPTAAQIEAALNSDSAGYAYPTTESYYNDPTFGLSGGVAHYAQTNANQFSVPADAGSVWTKSWQINAFCNLFLDWDAANAFWRWRFAVSIQSLRRWYDPGAGSYASWLGSIEFASAQLTNDIRPGAAGIALAPPASDPYGFHASGATLYSEYAA